MFYDFDGFPIDGGGLVQMIRRASQVAAKAVVSGALVAFCGGLVSIACLWIGLWMGLRTGTPGFHPDPGVLGWLKGCASLVLADIWAILLVIGAFAGAVVHFLLGYKYAIQALIHRLWMDGQERFLEPLIVWMQDALERHLPRTLQSAIRWGALRAGLLASLRQDPSVGIVRRLAIGWLLERIRADKLELQDREGFARSMAAAVRGIVAEIVEPSWIPTLVVAGAQGALAGVCLWMGLR